FPCRFGFHFYFRSCLGAKLNDIEVEGPVFWRNPAPVQQFFVLTGRFGSIPAKLHQFHSTSSDPSRNILNSCTFAAFPLPSRGDGRNPAELQHSF
ncbi:hypothetical protein, partial [Paenibacillus thiaminolyticus]